MKKNKKTKKALILEDKKKSLSQIRGWKEILKIYNYEIKSTRDYTKVKDLLKSGDYSLMLIHHSEFEEALSIKKDYPDLIYIGHSGYYAPEISEPFFIDFAAKMEEVYNHVISHNNSLFKILNLIEES